MEVRGQPNEGEILANLDAMEVQRKWLCSQSASTEAMFPGDSPFAKYFSLLLRHYLQSYTQENVPCE